MHLTTQERLYLRQMIDSHLRGGLAPDPPTGVDLEAVYAHLKPSPASVMAEALDSIQRMKTAPGGYTPLAPELATRALEIANQLESED
jgi:hypothetical protein